MEQLSAISGYRYDDSGLNESHDVLVPGLMKALERHNKGGARRAFDLGCGNGSVMKVLARAGYDTVGVDPSGEGIEAANRDHPELRCEIGSAYDDLAAKYGRFPVVISLEVVEHVYNPRLYASTLSSLVDDGGIAVVSTPYHSYLKNLAIALTGQMDRHFTALWDHGHIKFWSVDTLTRLLEEAGFTVEDVLRVGRIPALAKSMMLVARRGGGRPAVGSAPRA